MKEEEEQHRNDRYCLAKWKTRFGRSNLYLSLFKKKKKNGIYLRHTITEKKDSRAHFSKKEIICKWKSVKRIWRYTCSARWVLRRNTRKCALKWNKSHTHSRDEKRSFVACTNRMRMCVFVWLVSCKLFCRSHLPVIFHCVFAVRCIFDGNFLLLTHTSTSTHVNTVTINVYNE